MTCPAFSIIYLMRMMGSIYTRLGSAGSAVPEVST